MPRLRWFTWVGVLGAGLAGWSLLWLIFSTYLVQTFNRIAWLSTEINPSIGMRVMALLGVVILASEACDWFRRE